MLAHDMARQAGGRFLLRIEDIDPTRSRHEWETLIFEDLAWLGLDWERPVLRQSARMPAYRAALARLWKAGLLYPCRCTRRDIAEALAAPQEGASAPPGPDGPRYPGTCRPDTPQAPHAPLPEGVALRLHMARALEHLGARRLAFIETGSGPNGETGDIAVTARQLSDTAGDVVLARRDMGTSYHLAVVIDDAHQRVTHVVRGRDLFEATAIHVLLQALLDLPTPIYHHHRLIRDGSGRRLAKRDDARAIAKYRSDGATPDAVRRMVALPVLLHGSNTSG